MARSNVRSGDISNGSITANKLSSTAISDKLGYTPLSSDDVSLFGSEIYGYINFTNEGLVDNAPESLNTLGKLATAVETKASKSTTITIGSETFDLSSNITFNVTGFSGDYNDLTNKPTLFSGRYEDLTNKPTLFSGSYTDLTNKPILADVATSGRYEDLTNKPVGLATETYVNTQISNLIDTAPETLNTLNELAAALGDDPNFATTISTQIGLKANSANLATVATTGSFNDLTNKPTLFSGSYEDLTNKPTLSTVATTGSFNDLTNKPTLSTVATTGSYNDLRDKPTGLDLNSITADQALLGNVTIIGNTLSTIDSYGNTSTLQVLNQLDVVTPGIQEIVYNQENGSITDTVSAVLGYPSIGNGYIQIRGAQNIQSNIISGTKLFLSFTYNSVNYSGTFIALNVYFNPDNNNSLFIYMDPFSITGSMAPIFTNTYNGTLVPVSKIAKLEPIENTLSINATDGIKLNDQRLATETYVNTQISNLIDTAPETLDTLNELAAALGDDPNFATTISTQIGLKANSADLATVATSGSYNDLTNKPTLFSGSYNDLTNKPTLFSGSYTDLTNKPTLFSGRYEDLTNKPTLSTVATTGSYTDLTNKPTLFSGSYTDLTDKPTLFSGRYEDLTNKPTIPNLTSVGSSIIPSTSVLYSLGSSTLKWGFGYIANGFLESVNVSGAIIINGSRGTAGQVLTSAGEMASPTWSNISYNDLTNKPTIPNLTSVGSSIIPSTNILYSLGSSSFKWGNAHIANGFIDFVNVTGAISINASRGTAGQVLTSAGTMSSPTWSNISYNNLTNLPTFKTINGQTIIGTGDIEITSGAVSYNDLTDKPILATVATSGSYNDLINKPTLFSGSYNDLTNKPTLFSGSYTDLTNKPALSTVAISGSYNDLTNKPTLFSGSYNDLTNAPDFTGITISGGKLGIGGTPISSLDVFGNSSTTQIQKTGILTTNSTIDFDCSLSNIYSLTLASNATYTFNIINVPAVRFFPLILIITITSNNPIIVWPTNTKWPGGSAPSLLSGRSHVINLVYDKDGAIRGNYAVNYTL
jgi:hypothetical protein